MFERNKKKIGKRHPNHEDFPDQVAKDVKFAAHKQHQRLNHDPLFHILTLIFFFVAWIILTIRLESIPIRYFSIFFGMGIILFMTSYISKQDFIHK